MASCNDKPTHDAWTFYGDIWICNINANIADILTFVFNLGNLIKHNKSLARKYSYLHRLTYIS